jgi:signal transduction histidine kinase
MIISTAVDSHPMAENGPMLSTLNEALLLIAGDAPLEQILERIVAAAARLVDARYAALGVTDAEGQMVTFVHTGMAQELVAQMPRLPQGQGVLGWLVNHPQTLRLQDVQQHPAAVGFPPGHPPMHSFLGVPLIAGDEVVGTLYLTEKRDTAQFSEQDQALVELFAAQAAIAITKARLYSRMEQLVVLSERNRIGMDLHDGVIQSIYAVGLTLESLRMTLAEEGEGQQLLDTAIRGLNGAIQDIRNFIMDLRPRRFSGDLREGIRQLVREFQANTLIVVRLHSPARTDLLDMATARTLFLTTQEGLANVARHARAKSADITLTERSGQIILTIRDDGRGFNPDSGVYRVGHGLANMESRARELNGEFVVQSAPGQGTVMRLALPFSRQ